MTQEFDPVGHYDAYGDAEADRLTATLYGRLEFEGTQHVLESTLPAEGHVLDVGSGPGRYTEWLADRGYTVTAVDPSERQRELARERLSPYIESGTVSVVGGDVCALATETDSADATLCLGGPLSHVLTAADRRRAAAELRRVTVPEGPVVVSVMGRLAALQTILRVAGRNGHDETAILPDLARDGTYDDALLDGTDLEPTAPPMHLFRVTELETLLEDVGLTVTGVTGLEGVLSQRREEFEGLDASARDAIRETVAAQRWDRGVADLSGHFLATARA